MSYDSETTLSDHLIAFLLSARSTRIYYRILRERAEKRKYSKNAFYQSVYHLKKRGIISIKDDVVILSRGYIKKSPVFISTKEKGSTIDILLAFDIPESKKRSRDWLRAQLRFWEFEMIQKSLWRGKGPLPKEFRERLKALGIDDSVRIFTIVGKRK